MKKFFCFLVCSLLLFSCEKERADGLWDPMEWDADVTYIEDKEIEVPKNGGTYTFVCKNYQYFWLSSLREGDEYIEKDSTSLYAEGSWTSVKIQENVMTIVISSNESNQSRSVTVMPTAGDIFDYITFNQKGVGD